MTNAELQRILAGYPGDWHVLAAAGIDLIEHPESREKRGSGTWFSYPDSTRLVAVVDAEGETERRMRYRAADGWFEDDDWSE